MKEILQSLNLPKQILDKTEKFIITLFGPSAKELGELFADKIRYSRMKNQIKIFSKTIELLENRGLSARELNLKTLVPLIEQSSLEDDEILQNKWANLIANISSSPESGLEPKLIKTLSNLSSLEAQVLDFIFKKFSEDRLKYFESYRDRIWFRIEKIEDVKVGQISIYYSDIQKNFKLTDDFTRICIDNLESLGLIKFNEPEIRIDKGGTEAEVKIEEKRGQYIDMDDLDFSASYYQSQDFHLTAYGKYFIEQCKSED